MVGKILQQLVMLWRFGVQSLITFVMSIRNVGIINTVHRVSNKIHPALSFCYDRSVRQYEEWSRRRRDSVKSVFLISIIVPVYNTKPTYLTEMVESVLSQTFSNWELIMVDDCSTMEETWLAVQEFAEFDVRIRVYRMAHNSGISRTTNFGIKQCRGQYVTFLDHDDLLTPDALECVCQEILRDSPELVYSDEDKIKLNGVLGEPFLKPDWSPELLLSCNYIAHLAVYQKKLGDHIGWFDERYDGSQDYDFVLRFTEQAKNVRHIPRVLYHWRKGVSSTALFSRAKPYAQNAGVACVFSALQRRGIHGEVSTRQIIPGHYHIDLKEHARPVTITVRGRRVYREECLIGDFIDDDKELHSCILQIVHGLRDDENVVFMFNPAADREVNSVSERLNSLLTLDEIGFSSCTVVDKKSNIILSSGIVHETGGISKYGMGRRAGQLGYFGSLIDLRNVPYVAVEVWAIRRNVILEALSDTPFVPGLGLQTWINEICEKLSKRGLRHVVDSSVNYRCSRSLSTTKWESRSLRMPSRHPESIAQSMRSVIQREAVFYTCD